MKIDFKQRLQNLDGGDLMSDSGLDEKGIKVRAEEYWTLDTVCVNVLLGSVEGEKIDGSKKYAQYELAGKVKKGGELKTEEVALIKELIGKMYPPVIVGASWDLLEGKK